jgi:hypothetical protein
VAQGKPAGCSVVHFALLLSENALTFLADGAVVRLQPKVPPATSECLQRMTSILAARCTMRIAPCLCSSCMPLVLEPPSCITHLPRVCRAVMYSLQLLWQPVRSETWCALQQEHLPMPHWNSCWQPNFPPLCSKSSHDLPLFPTPERSKHNEAALFPLLNVWNCVECVLLRPHVS